MLPAFSLPPPRTLTLQQCPSMEKNEEEKGLFMFVCILGSFHLRDTHIFLQKKTLL